MIYFSGAGSSGSSRRMTMHRRPTQSTGTFTRALLPPSRTIRSIIENPSTFTSIGVAMYAQCVHQLYIVLTCILGMHSVCTGGDGIENAKQKQVLELRYFSPQPMTWEEIAEKMGLDERWVRRVHGYALLEYGRVADGTKSRG